MKLKKDITFIYMDNADYQNYEPIYEEAKKRGYKTRMTNDKFAQCEIGIYCQHVNFPQFSKFSVIMLHDIIQAYSRWPDIWFKEPWNKYDIGILPGRMWRDMWYNASKYFYACPKHGVYEIGWPKADYLGTLNIDDIRKKLEKVYNIDSSKKTILYAPAWENDHK